MREETSGRFSLLKRSYSLIDQAVGYFGEWYINAVRHELENRGIETTFIDGRIEFRLPRDYRD